MDVYRYHKVFGAVNLSALAMVLVAENLLPYGTYLAFNLTYYCWLVFAFSLWIWADLLFRYLYSRIPYGDTVYLTLAGLATFVGSVVLFLFVLFYSIFLQRNIVCQTLRFEAVYEWSVSHVEMYRVNGILARWMQDIDLPKGQVANPEVAIVEEEGTHVLRLRAGDSLCVYREQQGRWVRSK